jgi:hypothetical protein
MYFFKKGDTIQGGTLFKKIRHMILILKTSTADTVHFMWIELRKFEIEPILP